MNKIITKILDKLFVGDTQWAEEDLDRLNIGHVLNVCGVDVGTKRRYTHIHLSDDGFNQPSSFSTILAVLGDELARGWSTLVCCRAGMSRSVFVCILWLERMGMSRDEAYAYVKAKHPIAQVNYDLWRSV